MDPNVNNNSDNQNSERPPSPQAVPRSQPPNIPSMFSPEGLTINSPLAFYGLAGYTMWVIGNRFFNKKTKYPDGTSGSCPVQADLQLEFNK